MKKLFCIILTALIIFSNICMLKAKSIEKLGSEGQIDNVGVSYEMTYNGVPSTVYYGINGIDIISRNEKTHFQTEFPILKLIVISDVDKDGNSDFLVFEKVAEFNDQLFVISSKDGSVISSARLSHSGYDDYLGNVENNSYILDMRYEKGKVLVLYDYKIVNINPEDCSVIYEFENKDNIWDFEIIEDRIYFIDQLGQFGILDSETGEAIEINTIANKYDVTLRFDNSYSFTAQMSLFDIYYDGSNLFVLSEDGYIYLYDFENNSFESLPIGLISEEDFLNIISENYGWNNGPVYVPTGIFRGNFRGYKIIDNNATHLLISCYFLDEESLAMDVDFMYTQKYVLYDKENKTVTLFGGNVSAIKYGKAVFAQYETAGEVKDVVTTVFASEDKRLRVNIFDYEGNQLFQKDIIVDSLQSTSKYNFKYNETEGYLLEIFSGGSIRIDKKLSSTAYLYDTLYTNMEIVRPDYIILSYKVNGITNKIAKYQKDLETLIWSYELKIKDRNRGFETLKYEDFNMDGIDDVIGVVISYNAKNEPINSNYIIIDGASGKVLANKKIYLYDNYDAKGRKYKVYSTSTDIDLIRDLNGDKKKELLIPEGIVATNSWSLKGSIDASMDTKGLAYSIGDINKDGFADYISISDTKVEMWTSKIYGTYNVEYKKQKASISMNKDLMNMTYGTVFADINNDGIKEFVLLNRNAQGHQIFDVYNGKTFKKMYSLCRDGVYDYENFALLDFDFNNDGYNEIYHSTYYWGTYVIIDGKTGEDLTRISRYEYDNIEIKEEYNYHPEYLVPFTIEEKPVTGLIAVRDFSGDGVNDFAVLKSYHDQQQWRQVNALMVYDAMTFDLLKEEKLSSSDRVVEEFYDVENSEKYILARAGNDKIMLIDLEQFKDVAEYSLTGEKYYLINDDTIVVTTAQNEVYTIDIGESFEIISKFDDQISNNVILLEWKTVVPYAITSIYDNNTLITVTQDKQFELKLTEGHHTITLTLNDGQGKSSKASFEITVLKQNSNSGYIVGLAAVAVIAGFVLNFYRKTYVKKMSKEGLK
ncbi:MAG: FG-GAP repeat domain-containing protein [Erysipelotrichaceae bacterium]|jgi:hypothetical protein